MGVHTDCTRQGRGESFVIGGNQQQTSYKLPVLVGLGSQEVKLVIILTSRIQGFIPALYIILTYKDDTYTVELVNYTI